MKTLKTMSFGVPHILTHLGAFAFPMGECMEVSDLFVFLSGGQLFGVPMPCPDAALGGRHELLE